MLSILGSRKIIKPRLGYLTFRKLGKAKAVIVPN